MNKLLGVNVLVLMVAAAAVAAETPDRSPVVGLPLTGDDAIEFLRNADMVGELETFDKLAITGPRRATFSDGRRTLRAVFKDENTYYRGTFEFGDGRKVVRVKDSYKHEIAAFELDRLLGLGIVAPCVERKFGKRKGSLCLWVEGSMTEADRKKQGLEPPDPTRWSRQLRTLRLFQQLISDQDFSNIRNIVVDTEFRVYKIDSSMAFYSDRTLIERLHPRAYSRRFINALEALERERLDEAMRPWLDKTEIKALWLRRDRILDRVDRLVADKGEAAVLY
jgi:hypothetical protein